MPIYEYQCPQCRKVFEEWVKTADAQGQEACPTCGAASPRIMSQTSFVLKGEGWYVSEYGYRKNLKEDGDVAPKGDTAETTAAASAETSAAEASASAPAADVAAASPAAPAAKAEVKAAPPSETKARAQGKALAAKGAAAS